MKTRKYIYIGFKFLIIHAEIELLAVLHPEKQTNCLIRQNNKMIMIIVLLIIFLYVKNTKEAKNQYLIKKHDEVGLDKCEENRQAFLLNIQIMFRMSIKLSKGTT